MKKITTETIRRMKKDNKKITMLTAYDYPTAEVLDEVGIDILLVGDSLGMVVLGYEDTTQVTMEDMLHHVKAVARGSKQALIVADMPFLSYHIGINETVKNAGRFIQEGKANAVKLEGGKEVANQIQAIVNTGIPVMGHIGLTPQSIHQLGGYFYQGKTEEQARKLIEDAKSLEKAGVFSIVLECIPGEVAKEITKNITIPTIGIGAGADCDGQVLVIHDILGMYPRITPKFVKQYTNVREQIIKAVSTYKEDVQNNNFPREEHVFHFKNDLGKVYGGDNQ